MAHKQGSLNFYEVLGVLPDSTEKEILKGYRKKALACHPDKNPDNPKAAELFHQLSEALKVLTDVKARAAYDAVLKAKEAHKLRTQALDAKRKKFKEDLESRESSAKQEKEDDVAAARNFEEEIERLREEGSRLLKEQQEYLKSQIREERAKKPEFSVTPKLKVRWKVDKKDRENGGYSFETLMDIFKMYGPVSTLILSAKKNGLAIVEYGKVSQAALALEFERGFPDNPLRLSWLEGEQQEQKGDENKTGMKQQMPEKVGDSSSFDFESMVLLKMQQAQEKKNVKNEKMSYEKPSET